MTIEEVAVFAQTCHLHLKPKCVAEFSRTMEKEIIPLLRKQDGFQDIVALIVPGGMAAIGISLWSEEEDVKHYARRTYPSVLKTLANVLNGNPQVLTYEVSNSTFHKVAVLGTYGSKL
jgi:hypothetical protein